MDASTLLFSAHHPPILAKSTNAWKQRVDAQVWPFLAMTTILAQLTHATPLQWQDAFTHQSHAHHPLLVKFGHATEPWDVAHSKTT